MFEITTLNIFEIEKIVEYKEIFSELDKVDVRIEPNHKIYLRIFEVFQNYKIIIEEEYHINLDYEKVIFNRKEITDEVINYIKQRKNSCKNPYLLYIYSHTNFLFNSDYSEITSIVKELKYMVNTFLISEFQMKNVSFLAKSVNKCISLCLSYNNTELVNDLNNLISEILHFQIKRKIYVGNIALTNIYLEQKKIRTVYDFSLLEQSILSQIESFPENIPIIFSSGKNIYNILRKLYQINKDELKIQNLDLKIAKRLEIDLNCPNMREMHKLLIYDELIKTLKLIGDQTKLDQIKNEKLICGRNVAQNETIPISNTMKITSEEIEGKLSFLNNYTPLQKLFFLNNEFKRYDFSTKEEVSIIDLCGKFQIEQDGRIRKNIGDLFVTNTIEVMQGYFQMIIEIFFTDDELNDALLDFISKTYPLRRKMLINGILRAYFDDYISAVHILVFQIEGILRDYLTFKGFSQYKIDMFGNDSLKSFGTCLSEIRKEKIFDSSVITILEYWCGNKGRNLRNHLAHGYPNMVIGLIDYYILILCLIMIPTIKIDFDKKKKIVNFSCDSLVIKDNIDS